MYFTSDSMLPDDQQPLIIKSQRHHQLHGALLSAETYQRCY